MDLIGTHNSNVFYNIYLFVGTRGHVSTHVEMP